MIIKATRVSPQQRELWMTELRAALAARSHQNSQFLEVSEVTPLQERLKHLLLDVRTRWSSTFLMLGKP
jgi:hypothetical protein